MPTYSYECKKCSHVTTVFHAMSATPKVKCEECGSGQVIRLLGAGAGLIFKGSGFYETDYKRGGASGGGDKGGKKSGGESKGESKSDKPKSDAKSSSKKSSTDAA